MKIYENFDGKKLIGEWEVVKETSAWVTLVSPRGHEYKFSKKTGRQAGYSWPGLTKTIDVKG